MLSLTERSNYVVGVIMYILFVYICTYHRPYRFCHCSESSGTSSGALKNDYVTILIWWSESRFYADKTKSQILSQILSSTSSAV